MDRSSLPEKGTPVTVHGFCSSFRTWTQDKQAHMRYEAREMCLAHQVGSNVERTYGRSDLLDFRRPLMEKWEQSLRAT